MSKGEQKAYLKEMTAQLKRQQDAINDLSAAEYKVARDAFASVGRNPAAEAAQAAYRADVAEEIMASFRNSLRKSGMSPLQAKTEATARTQAIMNKLAALHEPDMVAGGWMSPIPTSKGRADVNSSIGASWNQNDRVAGMDREADRAIANGRGDEKMNVKLEPCRGRGIR